MYVREIDFCTDIFQGIIFKQWPFDIVAHVILKKNCKSTKQFLILTN